MHSRKLLALVFLALSLSAAAEFRTITEAYEVDLSVLRLPGSENGTLTFKQCSDCDAQTVRVTVNTLYLINDRDFALAEFKDQLSRIRNKKDQYSSVLHHLESNTIKVVKVWL